MLKPRVFIPWLCGLLISVLLALPSCTTEPLQTDLLIPVDFLNLPENMVLTGFHTDKIEIKIEAPPNLLEDIHSQNPRYPVDLYTDLAYDPAGGSVSIEPGEYLLPVDEKRIPLRSGIRIVSTRPSYLSVTLDKKIGKTFKVIVPYTGKPAKGYRAMNAVADPASIELVGAFSKIQSIEEIRTKPVDLTDVNESFKKNVPLDLDIIGITLKPNQIVTVTVPVFQVRVSKTIEKIPIEIRNTDARVTIEPAPWITIEVRGPFETISSRETMEQIQSFIDLKGMPPGVYARNAYIEVPVGLVMTHAMPQVFIVKIE